MTTAQKTNTFAGFGGGGGGGGSETLAQTLALGNTTGGNNLILSTGDVITAESSLTLFSASGAIGSAMFITSGDSTGSNNAGDLYLTGGGSVNGRGGHIFIGGGFASGSGAGGSIFLTPNSSAGGDGKVEIGGILKLNSNLITNVLDPVSAQDAATKNYVDTHSAGTQNLNATLSFGNTTDGYDIIVSTGDSITGDNNLIITTVTGEIKLNKTVEIQAASLITSPAGSGFTLGYTQVESSGTGRFLTLNAQDGQGGGTLYLKGGHADIGSGGNGGDIIIIPGDGDGIGTKGVISVDNSLISNLLDPVSAQDAVTKAYVDGYASVTNGAFVGRSSSVSLFNLVASVPVAGTLYRLSWYLNARNPFGGTATVQVSTAWTDGYGANSQSPTLSLNPNKDTNLTRLIAPVVGSAITLTVTYSASVGTPLYDLYYNLERLR